MKTKTTREATHEFALIVQTLGTHGLPLRRITKRIPSESRLGVQVDDEGGDVDDSGLAV